MTITKNMILYFIRDMGITILGETKTEQQFAGIKHWIPEREDLSDEYLYLCDGAYSGENADIIGNGMYAGDFFTKGSRSEKSGAAKKMETVS